MPTDINSGFPTAEQVTSDFNGTSTDTPPTSGGGGTTSVEGATTGTTAPTTGVGPAPAGGTITQGAADAEPMYEVVVGGKKWRVPVSELTKGYQRQTDYTKKTMELSEQRRSWELERQEHMKQVEELQQWLQNPQAIAQYARDLMQRTGYDPAAPQNAAAMQQLDLNKVTQTIDQRMQQMEFEFHKRQLTNQYSGEIDSTIKGALDQHPELRKIQGIERVLRQEVAAREPGSLQEAKQVLLQIAQEQADELRSLRAEQAAAAAQRSAPLQNGIEPPGGTAPAPVAQGTPMKIGSPDFMQAVLKDIANASVANR